MFEFRSVVGDNKIGFISVVLVTNRVRVCCSSALNFLLNKMLSPDGAATNTLQSSCNEKYVLKWLLFFIVYNANFSFEIIQQ
jgi:hypothetical protein